MKDSQNYSIKIYGTLKYNRLKSISVFKNKLRLFGFNYSLVEVIDIFNQIMNNSFVEHFDGKYKYCLDSIFDGVQYENNIVLDDVYKDDCFPENWIPPVGCKN